MNLTERKRFAADLLELPLETIEKNCRYLDSDDALYVSIMVRGGDSLLIGNDGRFLYADSSVSFQEHLSEYRKGRRTELSDEEDEA